MAKVVKVRFDNENPVLSIILLDRKMREATKIDLGGVVTVTKGTLSMQAIVMPQFKEFVGKGVAVNGVLAMGLQIQEGDEVEVVKYEFPDTGEPRPRFPRSFLN